MKRITISSFKCDLESLNWSDETLDFYWTDHQDIGDQAQKVDGCLKVQNRHIFVISIFTEFSYFRI